MLVPRRPDVQARSSGRPPTAGRDAGTPPAAVAPPARAGERRARAAVPLHAHRDGAGTRDLPPPPHQVVTGHPRRLRDATDATRQARRLGAQRRRLDRPVRSGGPEPIRARAGGGPAGPAPWAGRSPHLSRRRRRSDAGRLRRPPGARPACGGGGGRHPAPRRRRRHDQPARSGRLHPCRPDRPHRPGRHDRGDRPGRLRRGRRATVAWRPGRPRRPSGDVGGAGRRRRDLPRRAGRAGGQRAPRTADRPSPGRGGDRSRLLPRRPHAVDPPPRRGLLRRVPHGARSGATGPAGHRHLALRDTSGPGVGMGLRQRTVRPDVRGVPRRAA